MCRTNVASNTAFRGFGCPQGLLTSEQWIDQIASKLDVLTDQVGINAWSLISLLFVIQHWYLDEKFCVLKQNVQKQR